MISIEEAHRRILDNLPPLRKERVGFQESLGRVLAEDVLADMDVPPFDRAAVDGYALRSVDVRAAPVELELAGELRAGSEADATLGPGQVIAVTTGAPIPAGADAVQWLEHAQHSQDTERVRIRKSLEPGDNIVPRGAEACRGTKVLSAGCTLGPQDLAVLATFGRTRINVWQRPRVAVLVTGDELIEIHETPRRGQIRNSNAYSLSAQVQRMGIQPDYLGIVRDDPVELGRSIAGGLDRDVLIVSGGASVGKYDYLKSVLQDLNVTILFSRVAVRPGKPTVFARNRSALVFGLPGNPVSSFVSFEIFVRPVLGRMCGHSRPDLFRVGGVLQEAMSQAPGRTSFLPAIARWDEGAWRIHPVSWKGSGDMIGFSRSNALVVFPGDRGSISAGEHVESLLLPDFFIRS